MVSYDWHVRIKRAAPDCFSKEVIVVNGEFQPSITVRQGNILQVRGPLRAWTPVAKCSQSPDDDARPLYAHHGTICGVRLTLVASAVATPEKVIKCL